MKILTFYVMIYERFTSGTLKYSFRKDMIMKNDFTPILVIPAVPHEGGIRFLYCKNQIDIGPEMAEKLWKILQFCNGYNTVEAIAEFSSLPLDEVSEILSELVELELVVDSREQYLHFHRIRNYPTGFNRNLSQDEVAEYSASPRKPVKSGEVLSFEKDENTFFSGILEKRRSCRSFSDKRLTLKQVGSLCHFAYFIKDHVVPSGGALYPLKIYMLAEKDQDGFKAGYYEYDAENDTLVLFNSEVDEEQLKYCFNQEEMPFGSSVQIIIAADLKRQPFKYANRGYTLTQVEVGHVAENISLYCAEQGLGACEMGGVQDEPLKRELELEDDIWPIISIPIGYPLGTETEPFNKIRYVEENIGDSHPVKKVWIEAFDNSGSFFGAGAIYRDESGEEQFSGATSTSDANAIFKATIEGYERFLSGQVRSDYFGKASDLKSWLHPYDYFPLTKEQAKKCGVSYFTKDLPISWTLGRKFDGTGVYVPSDIVYYGQKTGKNRIYFGHSSGIAAYSNYKEAEKRALVELIERDALMRNWYSHESPNIIAESILSIHTKKRISYWQKQNRKIMILEMPSKYGWVFEAIVVSNEYPFFVSGAAATIEKANIPNAIYKALQEAEYNLLLCINYPDNSEIDPKLVSTPTDHGKVYHMEKYADMLSWLWNGRKTEHFAKIGEWSVEALKRRLDVTTVDLSNPEYGLSVVRVLSPKLVQINFGFYSAHYDRLDLTVYEKSLMMPHYFA